MKVVSPFVQETDQYMKQIKSGLNSILVTVRVRPLNTKQKSISSYETVKVLDQKLLVLTEQQPINNIDVLRKNRNKDNQFAFDYVFDKHVKTQYIYENCMSILLSGLFEGYNATVLAYGPTSCGKTYTMVGQAQSPGIMALSVLDIINTANQLRKTKDINFKASYIEIYNQNIKDLLISQDKNFQLREDPKEGISIAGITQVSITNLNQIKMILKVGAKNRTIQSTGLNQNSSRSHAILQIQVQTKDKAQSTHQQINVCKLSLVDLAGSERASKTTNKGERMTEGAKINQSLLTLGNCIQILSEANQKGLKNPFVPYRGSKLTRLLKDSLGGNCRTVMISHVTPATSAFEQTYNTIIYANRAKSIKNNATRNILNAQTHINNYVNVINALKKQNEDLKTQLSVKKQYTNRNPLPIIQNSAYDEQIQKYQKTINSLMKDHKQLILAIGRITAKIEVLAFQIFQCELKKDNQAAVQKKTNQVSKLTRQKLEIQRKVQVLEQSVKKLQKQIGKNDILGKIGQPYILNLIKQNRVTIQTQALKIKQEALNQQMTLISKFLQKIKKDLNKRDKIIESQKILIKKNNIISRITYSQLNFSIDNLKQNSREDISLKKKQIKNPILDKNYSIPVGKLNKQPILFYDQREASQPKNKKKIAYSINTKSIQKQLGQNSPKKKNKKISDDASSQEDVSTFRNKKSTRRDRSVENLGRQQKKLKKITLKNHQNSLQKQKKKKPNDQKFDFVYMPH